MIVVHKNSAVFSAKSDSHHEIIAEHGLKETNVRREYNLVPVEITPENGDLSRPLTEWQFVVDCAGYERDLPPWWDAKKAEAACRAKLPEWAETRLKGWRVKEAFHPFNPLTRKTKTLPKKELRVLLKDWDSVRDSVGSSVWDSVRSSVRNSARDSVGSSVRDSVYGYIGSLFPNITDWEYTARKNPWRSIRKLWRNGYVPSFDGTTWRLHAHKDARVVLSISANDLRDGRARA